MSINAPPHEWDLSEAEKNLIKRRAELRTNMKMKFQKHSSDPYIQTKMFDPALQRWFSMKATCGDFYRPSARNILSPIFVFSVFGLMAYSYGKERNKRAAKLSSGKVTYYERKNKELYSY